MIRPEFSPQKFGPGYRRGEVDAFVERLLATVNGSPVGIPVGRAELADLALRPALFGERYSIEEVDRFVAGAAAWLPAPAVPPTGWLPAHDHPAPDPDPGHPPRPSFTVGRFREGYDMAEVDAFVDKVYAALDGRVVLTPADVQGIAFTPVRIREGYDVAEVDAFLDAAQTWLTR
jgi:DivIVA domain-containing protein